MKRLYKMRNRKIQNVEIKREFLTSAITDISSCIQFTDTKVSIIMGAIVALIVGVISCNDKVILLYSKICPCSWRGIITIIISLIHIISLIMVFIFGILTIRNHSSKIPFDSKWFISKTANDYSFEDFKKDVFKMNEVDIIENLSAELFKLNSINRQKNRTLRITIIFFTIAMLTAGLFIIILLTTII